MATPVIVSRIQNRRGTQDRFDGYVYNPAGPNSVYPFGYTGTGGYGSYPDFDSINYPNVLLAGELALCTDSGNVYMGNSNGEYIIVDTGANGATVLDRLEPYMWVLPPSGTYVNITRVGPGPNTLEYPSTPFINILYGVTNSSLEESNVVGTTFSRNGQLQITAVEYFSPDIPNPPYPDTTPASLSDVHTEINLSPTDVCNLSLIAQYDTVTNTMIQILYKHDFPTDLMFSTSTIKWVSL